MSGAPDRSRVPAGIGPRGGQFAPEARARSAIALSRGPVTAEDLRATVTQRLSEDGGFGPEAIGHHAAAWVEIAEAHGIGYDTACDYARAGLWPEDAVRLHEAGVSAQGWVSYREVLGRNTTVYEAISLAEKGTAAERIAQVQQDHDLNLPAARTLARVDDEALAAYLAKVRSRELGGEYATAGVILGLHQTGLDAERAAAWSTVLDDPDQAIRAQGARLDPAQVAAYRAASGITNPAALVTYAASGVKPEQAKEYGPRFEPDEVAYLAGAEVPGKVARSIRNEDRGLDATGIAAVHHAGITTGTEHAVWTAAEVPIDQVAAMRDRGLSADHAAELRRAGIPADMLADAVVLGPDPARWARAVVHRAQTSMRGQPGSPEQAVRHLIAFAASGGTPEDLARYQRAGVPITDAIEARDYEQSGGDVWTYATVHRQATLDDETEFNSRWGYGLPEPWPWTDDSYARG